MEQKDVTGEKYNKLLITGLAPSKREPSGRFVKRVYVLCDCGNTGEKSYKALKRGQIKSCGCLSPPPTKVEPGDVYSLWTVINETDGYFHNGEKADRTFLCKCFCGKEKEVNLQSLKKSSSKSCGCQGLPPKEKIEKIKIIPEDTREEQWKECVSYPGYYISTLGRLFNYRLQKHLKLNDNSYSITVDEKSKEFLAIKEMYKTFIGEYDESTYKLILNSTKIKLENVELIELDRERKAKLKGVYYEMKNRCTNPNSKDYKNYGERGIRIEESFDTFEKFYMWAIENGYTLDSKLEIDRENNDGNYSVDNCRLITKKDNNRNMRRNVMTWELVDKLREGEYKGLSNKEASQIIGCCEGTIRSVRNYHTWVK